MGRILAIDYGSARTGIAVTDPLRIIPGALTTLPAKQVIPFLKEYCSKEQVDIIVVGKAMHTNKFEESDSMKKIHPFVAALRKEFPNIEVVLHDERYTSVMAKQVIHESGLGKSKRKEKSLVDRVSATIILESYLFSMRYREEHNIPNH